MSRRTISVATRIQSKYLAWSQRTLHRLEQGHRSWDGNRSCLICANHHVNIAEMQDILVRGTSYCNRGCPKNVEVCTKRGCPSGAVPCSVLTLLWCRQQHNAVQRDGSSLHTVWWWNNMSLWWYAWCQHLKVGFGSQSTTNDIITWLFIKLSYFRCFLSRESVASHSRYIVSDTHQPDPTIVNRCEEI